jgi:hypothetical protein
VAERRAVAEGGGGKTDARVGDRLASVVMVWHPIIELGFL